MVSVAYHTDPACPWSWAFEPAVRKLMVDFGGELDWTFVMGGLHRSLAGEPALRATLAEQWLRVSAETQAPLDPLLWADGPISSTYPACMAVKAAAEQADDGGYRYLRRLRESLMCDRRKLDQSEALIEEGTVAGLDVGRFRIDLHSNAITESFATDLERTKALGARLASAEGLPKGPASSGAGGTPLPTLVLTGEGGQERILAGFQVPDTVHAAALECGARAGDGAPLGVEGAIRRFGRMTTREVEVLCGLPGPRASAELFRLAEEWRLRPLRRPTGYLWEAAEGH